MITRAAVILLLIVVCGTGAAAAGTDAAKMTLKDLEVQGWQPVGDIRTYVGPKLEEAIDGFVDFYLGFRYLDTEHRIFQKGDKRLEVFVHRFDTVQDAFGLYTVRRSPGKLLEIGDHATLGQQPNLMAWRGPFCIRVAQVGRSEVTADDMSPFAETLAAQVEGKFEVPPLVKALPAEKVDWLTLRYLHYRNAFDQVLNVSFENVFLLGEDLEERKWDVDCVLAEVTVEDAPQLIVIVRYPDEQKPQEVVKMLSQVAIDEGQKGGSEGAWADYVARSGKHTLIYRDGTLLGYAIDVAKVDAVKTLIQEIIAKAK